MAVRKPAPKKQPKTVNGNGNGNGNGVEQQVMAFADQIGWSLGTIRAKAEVWVDREAVRSEVMHIRNSAEHLLLHFNRDGASPNGNGHGNGATSSNGARKPAVVATLGASRGAKKMARTTGKHAMRYGRS